MHSKVLEKLALIIALLLPAAAYAILPIQQWQTAAGARVYFVENHDLPMFDLSVEFPAGAAFDSQEKSGAASMTSHLLRHGADGMDEDEIARRLADVGALLSPRFGTDSAGLALRSLSRQDAREQALDIFSRVLQKPDFPRAVLEREKGRLIASIKEADTKPDTIASRTFYRLVYREHPYALRSSGEIDTIGTLERGDLQSFYGRHYTVQNATVALIGDLTREQAERIAEMVTAGLPPSTSSDPVVPPVSPLADGLSRMIPHPAKQAHILIGAPGIRRDDPDYFPLVVGNYILGGGGFVSRIVDEVRQKRGLAYAAYSYLSPLQQQGPFVIGMQTQSDQVTLALSVVRDTLRQFLDKGPTEKELTLAKQNIIGGFPMRIDSNRKIHEYLGLIGFYRLPLTYLDDYVKNVERVTAVEIKQAFSRHVDPRKLVTVVVGASDGSSAAGAAK